MRPGFPDAVAVARLAGQQGVDLGLFEDALGEGVFARRQFERRADIEHEKTGALTEGEQRLHRGQGTDPGGRCAAKAVGVGMQVDEGDHP